MFQSLEGRSLTEEEQAVIDARVALQRKMFEEYEKREHKRKIIELREVCPDISEEEAEKALEMCNNNEEESASRLVSDPSFRRRVVLAVAAAASADPDSDEQHIPDLNNTTTISNNNRSAKRSNINKNWPSKPSGPRPRLVDPATLGTSVFVGAFRGKGFERNAGKAAAGSQRKLLSAASKQAEEPEEIQPPAETDNIDKGKQPANNNITSTRKKPTKPEPSIDSTAISEGSMDPESRRLAKQQQQKELGSDADSPATSKEGKQHPSQKKQTKNARSPPNTIPKTYALARETSTGELVPMTESELKRTGNTGRPVSVRKMSARGAGGSISEVTVTDNNANADDAAAAEKEKEAEATPSSSRPRRAASARAAVISAIAAGKSPFIHTSNNNTTTSNATSNLGEMDPVAMLPAIAIKMAGIENDKAVDLLMKLQPHVVAAALERLGNDEPERAVTLRTMLDAAVAEATTNNNNNNNYATNVNGGKKKGGASSIGASPLSEVYAAVVAAAEEKDGEGSKRKRVPSVRKMEELVEEEEEDVEEYMPTTSKRGKRRHSTTAALAAAVAAATPPPVEEDGDETTEDEDEETKALGTVAAVPASNPLPAAAVETKKPPKIRAISSTGHTNRGRVKQKSHKSADLINAGTLIARKGWYNPGYIFPAGFHSRTLFRSSVALDQLCVHECYIIGQGGDYWPAPTYKVVSLDRPDEPIVAKSCTGCWTGILKRINNEIEARRRAGEDLPPPPKTAIAGPEYFGLNQPNIVEEVEALDPERKCVEYWSGKADREAMAAGLPVVTSAPSGMRAPKPRAPRASSGGGGGNGGGGRRRKRNDDMSDDDNDNDNDGLGDDEDETTYMTNKWSAVSRNERYKKRLMDQGEDASAVDEDNPLPHLVDPITLEPVVRPAISPYGHVMGMATWRAVLGENGKCPFTKQPLNAEQCKVLTKHNIELYRDRIIK